MSTGTTTKGLPYPNGDDPVSQGDDRIKALAQALDITYAQQLSPASAWTATTPPGNYPVGWSVIQPGANDATNGGWPTTPPSPGTATGGLILTYRYATSVALQFMLRNSGTRTSLYFRNASVTWGPWVQLDSLGAVYAYASGIATVAMNTATPQTGTLTVTFPSPSPFSAGANLPKVQCTPTNWLHVAAISSVSATAFTLNLRRSDGGTGAANNVDVHWTATQP